MPSQILLIDADATFTAELTRALEARGLAVRATGDGAGGIELARDQRPHAIVLCVELPRMSGYAVCQRIRKDEELKSIPLVITSSEATAETFENHRKLKVRADAYLHKPFAAAHLLDTLRSLIPLPEAPSGEDVVTLDDVEELSGEMPLEPLPERNGQELPSEDEDLKLLDTAFDHIASDAAVPAPAALDEQPLAGDDLRAATALLPAEDESAHSAIDRLGEEADKALAALGADEGADLARAAPLLGDRHGAIPDGESDELLRAAGVQVVPPEIAAASAQKDEEIRRQQQRISELLIEVARAQEAAQRREAEAGQLRRQAEAQDGRLRALESDAGVRERQAQHAAQDLERRLEEARQQLEQVRGDAQQQMERVRSDVQQQVERARGEAERQAAAGRELEARAQRAEEAAHQADAERRRMDDLRTHAEEQARRAVERAGQLESEIAALKLRVEETDQAHGMKAALLAEAQGSHDALSRRLAGVEAELAEAQALRPQLEALRGELDVSRAESEAARAEAERGAGELQRRLLELQAVNAKHEERIVKAYQKIKSDEKIREKTRKALAIALQLLDERLAAPAKEGEGVPRRE